MPLKTLEKVKVS